MVKAMAVSSAHYPGLTGKSILSRTLGNDRELNIVTAAIKSELPDKVLAIDICINPEKRHWVVRAWINGFEGCVDIDIHETSGNAIKEIADKIRAFC
jgi:hypothetical protein